MFFPFQLFVAGNYIGDGEVVTEMNERGELEELVQEYKVCGNFVSLKRFIRVTLPFAMNVQMDGNP